MRRRILIVLLLTVVSTSSIASAQPFTTCGWASCVYLAAVSGNHIVPPPPIAAAVMQQVDLGSDYRRYTVEIFREVPNSEAAKGYKNEQTALRDFATQGRETSFVSQYSNTSARFVLTQDQVYRYTTSDGAALGQAYTAAGAQRDHPDFVPFVVSGFDGFGAPTVQLTRQMDVNGITYYQYFISVQIGRYVTEIQVIGQSTAGWAIEAAIPAVDRLKAFPQT